MDVDVKEASARMIAPGTRLGAYEVTARIGAGGMGEVYRAHDAKLGRDVAIKVLPIEFSGDPDRHLRFEHEARVLASLNHPNIAAIYGFEDSPGVRALVMELVDGVTLAERIARGPIGIVEALSIARQIADALDAAHERGIVHRDLKPANIKLTPDGQVKVLDFGLAKTTLAAGGVERSGLATATNMDTSVGVVLGTAAYMSPEQARGQAVDKRTDIWAFGCVLFEMLTTRSPFAGQTLSDTVAAILQGEPDWSALPKKLPAEVERVLRRCLTKDPKQRVRDVGDIRFDPDDALASGSVTEPASGSGVTRGQALPWTLGVLSLVLATVLAARLWMAPSADPAGTGVTRATITLPANQELDTRDTAAPLALSRDGRRLAYVAKDGREFQLFIRSMEEFAARPVAGSEGARYPFFSPDGSAIAFFLPGQLMRVGVQGGRPVKVCDVPAIMQGGTWGADDTIVFATAASGLMRVPASGGTPVQVSTRGQVPRILSWPQFLPGSRAVLATAGPALDASMGILSLETGTWREIGQGFQAQALPSGHLIFHASAVREGEIRAARFDLAGHTIQYTAVPVVDGVFRAENGGGAYFAAAEGGTFVFARGGHARTLVRVDRNGRRTPLLQDRRGFRMPRLSPNGRYVAVTVDPRPSEVWVYDLVRQTGFALATGGHNISPVWSPDGRSIAYFSQGDMYRRPADGSGKAENLLRSEGPQYPGAWTPDGRAIVYVEDQLANRSDVWLLTLGAEARPLIAESAREFGPRISPDGRWLAYASQESGRRVEVYVRPYPNVDAGKWLVSTNGGLNPVWSPDGRQLYYVNGSTVMSVAVTTRGHTFDAGEPQELFSGPFETGSPQFDVAADGTFVMVEADPDAKPTQIHVVLNWAEELKRLVP
jgi:Tol biopolymer transport system component